MSSIWLVLKGKRGRLGDEVPYTVHRTQKGANTMCGQLKEDLAEEGYNFHVEEWELYD